MPGHRKERRGKQSTGNGGIQRPTTGYATPIRVVTVGAGGNVGTAPLRRLRTEPDLDLIGVSRRGPAPDVPYADVEWHVADTGAENAAAGLADVLRGSAAVVNLAW